MLDFIRIGCAVPPVTVGDAQKNTEDVCEKIRQADTQGCDVVVFPELALTGYYDKADEGQSEIIAQFADGEAKACEITFPSSGGGATFNAFVKGYSIGSADVDGVVGFGATLRITGAVTPST